MEKGIIKPGTTSSTGTTSNAGTATATANPEEDLANGGSKNWRDADPAAYDRGGGSGGFGGWAVLLLFAVIVTPLGVRGVVRYFKGT